MLHACGVHTIDVRDLNALNECDGLVLPGGESTTMSRLCDRYGLWEPLRERIHNGMAAFGTCAGMILLANEIEGATRNFEQRSLQVLDIGVARNAYGAQVDSFEADVELKGDETPLRAVFIRAPVVTRVGPEVEVLATHRDQPVVVRRGNIMAAAFHPEIAGESRLHRLWLESIDGH